MNPEELQQALQALFNQDLRYEVIIRAMVDVLVSKKNADGTPFLTIDEVNKRAEQIKTELIEASRKPQIIVPATTGANTTLATPVV
jgi:hypothetical protein